MDCFVILFGFLKENFVLALIFLPPPRTACNLRWREAAANSKSSCSKPLFSSQILTLNSRSLSYLLGCVGLSGTRVTPPSFLLKLRGQADFHRFKMSCPSSLQHFCLFLLILAVPAFSQSSVANTKVLHVGKELLKETLPLQSGSCLYQLQGLRSNMWYEVKISYPASIPASFSLQLKNASSDPELNFGRKLLNTEKLIFKTDKLESLDDQFVMNYFLAFLTRPGMWRYWYCFAWLLHS
ncbi:uncharacterized protein [Coffea arabica]|uniref:Uncharacterized protein isoform X3 n=1 Tax=Coffea arabica TaxID=13443 RepID=A0A6P6TTU8_COFAR|nr:uncharacterized protein LOC113703991 isoform X3 [Coffea arabica]